MTRVPPASPWSASASEAPEGEREVVAISFTMKMTNFANTPAYTEPSEPEPVDQQPAGPLPTTGDPDAVVTTDSPGSGHTDPGPVPVEPVPTPDATLDKFLEQLAQAPAPINPPQQSLAPLAEPTEQLDQPEARPPQLALTEPATDPLDAIQPDITDALQQQASATEQAQEQAPTEPTESAEPLEPIEPDEEAEPDPTPPAVAGGEPAEDDEDQQDKPSTVFDEDSVDQPIAFDRMARPKPAAVSKRLGESGTVRILVEVDEQGRLIRKTVLDATEYPRLLKASLAALERSTFLPAERAGEPVHSTRIIEYRF